MGRNLEHNPRLNLVDNSGCMFPSVRGKLLPAVSVVSLRVHTSPHYRHHTPRLAKPLQRRVLLPKEWTSTPMALWLKQKEFTLNVNNLLFTLTHLHSNHFTISLRTAEWIINICVNKESIYCGPRKQKHSPKSSCFLLLQRYHLQTSLKSEFALASTHQLVCVCVWFMGWF